MGWEKRDQGNFETKKILPRAPRVEPMEMPASPTCSHTLAFKEFGSVQFQGMVPLRVLEESTSNCTRTMVTAA